MHICVRVCVCVRVCRLISICTDDTNLECSTQNQTVLSEVVLLLDSSLEPRITHKFDRPGMYFKE